MRKQREQDLDMTPMVDVSFLVLIFFMVTASFSIQRAIESPNPVSEQASTRPVDLEREIDPVRLHVDHDGAFLLMAADWQREPVGKRNLIQDLADARKEMSSRGRLQIEIDPEAKLQVLVDAIDAATIAGFEGYSLTEVDSQLI